MIVGPYIYIFSTRLVLNCVTTRLILTAGASSAEPAAAAGHVIQAFGNLVAGACYSSCSSRGFLNCRARPKSAPPAVVDCRFNGGLSIRTIRPALRTGSSM